jgi:DNA-binding response OmpR family regulator
MPAFNPTRVRDVEQEAATATDDRTILLIEDDPDIARLIERELLVHHYRVERFENAQEGLRRARRSDVGLIVLDLLLPDMHGFDVCRRLRCEDATRGVPIVMVTALSDEGCRVRGFEAGADDYVTKPFSIRELVTRIRALLRRAAMVRRPATETRGDLSIDRRRHEVVVRGESVTLTPTEFSLLDFFARHPDRVFSRDELLTHLWGEECLILEHNLDVHICSLRRKIERDPKRPALLVTLRNVGFKLVDAC